MMIKVALAIFLSLIPAYAIKAKAGNEVIDIPDEINHMNAVYYSGANNDSYIDAINAVLQKPEENFKFSISNDVHKCYFSKFDIEINDEHSAIRKLFRDENKTIIEDAIKDYKSLLMLNLDENAKKEIDMTKLPEHFQDMGVKYFGSIRPSFFHKNSCNGNQIPTNNGVEIDYDKNELNLLRNGRNKNSDLSKANHNEPNNDKLRKNMIISSQQIIIHNKNGNDEVGETENEEYYKNMNKEKALEIFMKNTNLNMVGICTTLKDNENEYMGQCAAKMNKHYSSIACNSHKNDFLKHDQKNKELSPEMIHEKLNSRMSEMAKFFENPEEATGMLLSALSKPGLMGSINSLDIVSHLNSDQSHKAMTPEELFDLDNNVIPNKSIDDIDQDKTN
ncbi:parasitophorous vacuolar protein 1, putative [Plasmodium chabaudi adami]|uniref:Parasitophorous vacuolar protein 1, putative n=1 Tax=Plasmodium chabaudi adami TaxID=5826 RepID=A0A1C6YD29_PLACE|nr:parasitophorous vacuolar protein 1, putative [Plasmodium chabaudi adami]